MKLKLFLIMLTIIVLSSCSPKGDSSASVIKSSISRDDISSGNCMNIGKLMGLIQDPRFTYPVQTMVTDLKALVPISENQIDYFSFVNFNYTNLNVDHAGLFPQVQQPDCQTVQILSASNDILTFNITESSDRHLKFVLVDTFGDGVSDDLKKALYARDQPYEYTVDMISDTSLNYSEKFRTINPICDASPTVELMVTKNVSWGETAADLPDHFIVNLDYFSKVLEAINSTPSDDEKLGNLSVKEIQEIMATSIRTDIESCN